MPDIENLTGADATDFAAVINGVARPSVRAYNDGAQSIANNTSTPVTFNSHDGTATAGIHSTSTDTDRFVATKAGLWMFTYKVHLASDKDGTRISFMRKNGGTDSNNIIGSAVTVIPSASFGCVLQHTVQVELALNDYVQCLIYQNSGGALNAGYAIATDRGLASSMHATYLGPVAA